MESIIEQFAALDSVIKSAILGGVGGGLGMLITQPVADRLTKTGRNILVVVFFLLATQVPKFVFPEIMRGDQVSKIISEMEKLRYAEVIFKYYPEAKNELRTQLGRIINEVPRNQQRETAQIIVTKIMQKYMMKSLPNASDERVYFTIRRTSAATKHLLNADPKLCVGMFMGSPQIAAGDFRDALVKEESDLKASVVESSFLNPSKMVYAVSEEEMWGVLEKAYRKKGYDFSAVDKIEIIEKLPPKEGCKIAVEFSDALESLGEKEAVFVLKNVYRYSGL